MIRKALAALAALAAAAILLHVPARAADSIKVGVILVDSGPLAFAQPFVTEPAKLAVELINAQGGVLGRPFEIVTHAHSGTPAGAVAAATKLVQQNGASFLTGFNSSAAVLAIGPKLRGLNALLLDGNTAAEDQIGKNCQANYFRSSASDGMAMNVLGSVVRSSGAKTWNLIVPDSALGHDFAKSFKGLVAGSSGTLQTVLFAPAGTNDYGSYVTQLAAKPADGLGVVLLGADGIAFAKQQHQFGLFAKFKTVVTSNFTNDIVLQSQGETTVGVYSAQSYAPAMPGSQNAAFVKLFEARFKRPPNFIEADNYQVFELLRAAINKAGTTDVAAVRAALSGLNTTTIFGDVEMRAADHQLVRPMALMQIVKGADGKPVSVMRRFEPAASVTPPPSPECKFQ